jgi:hypothetical protein
MHLVDKANLFEIRKKALLPPDTALMCFRKWRCKYIDLGMQTALGEHRRK